MRTAEPYRTTRTVITLLAGFAAAGVVFAAPAAPPIHRVIIEGTRFVPETLTVHRGDRVVWVNKDPFPHTVTGRSGGFDSHSIAPDAAWRYVAGKAGTFPYVCTFHPTMTGTLVVK